MSKQPKRECDACGKVYQPQRATSKFCSSRCRYNAHMYKGRLRIPDDLRWDILSRDNFRCAYCGATPDDEELRVDHIVPIHEGGAPLEHENLVTACHRCNSGKGDSKMDPYHHTVAHITGGEEWMADE